MLSTDRMMLPGVTVVPTTVWLAVCVAMVGASNLHPSRLTPDQYAPLISHRHGLHKGTEEDLPFSKFLNDSDEDQSIEDSIGLQPKGQDRADNQPVSISISSYWKDQGVADQADPAISDKKSTYNDRLFAPQDLDLLKYLEKNLLRLRPWTGNNEAEDFSRLLRDKQLPEYADQQLLDPNIDLEKSSDPPGSPPRESQSQPEDPFVADDTFQDQGPGSVEIYKLDLLRERLLPKPMSTSKLPANGKSKVPKKTIHGSEKSKTTEYKAASPKMFEKQSNSFDDHSSETPPNTDPFSIGGVPELQVGCEGLAASRQKRSIDSASKDQEGDLWSDVTPISLDLDYDLSEEKFEEMDELFKLKKLETTTKGMKQNRGDMEATLYTEFQDGDKRSDKLPVRGDLGDSSAITDSAISTPMTIRNEHKFEKSRSSGKIKRSIQSEDTDVSTGERPHQMRKILWVNEPISNAQDHDPSNQQQLWGFGENEGLLSSDELQTENQRRRQFYEKALEQSKLRKQQENRLREEMINRTNADAEKIRRDYERLLEQKREEEKRRMSQDPRSLRRQQEEEEHRRRAEMEAERRRLEDARRNSEAFHRSRDWEHQTPAPRPRWQEEEDARRRQQTASQRPRWQEEEARRRQQEEEVRRRQEEENARRRQPQEDARRRQEEESVRRRQYEEESRRQLEEESRRRQQEEESRTRQQKEEAKRRQQGQDRVELEALRREWMTKRRQKEEEEARERNQPSNASVSANEDESRRREKLEEYIQRNQPVNVGSSGDRWRQEANRRRLEEEQRLQDYIRRNQPVQIPRNVTNDWMMHRRKMEEAGREDRPRYPGYGDGRRNHGPSAMANVEPSRHRDENRRRYPAWKTEEDRIRERLEEQRLREELRRRELEEQRLQSRRYEEQRQRIEAERRAAEKHAGKTSLLENMGSSYGDRRRYENHSRRQETSLVPANLVANEARRVAEHERRMEEQRRRMEEQRRRMEEQRRMEESRRRTDNARQRPGENRWQDTRENQERTRAVAEQRRRQELARLNSLSVSSRIIIRPTAHAPAPGFGSRIGPDDDFGLPELYLNRTGVPVPNFLAGRTQRPPVKRPTPCVWAVAQCCPSTNNRLLPCFETLGCPGVNWDRNPCRFSLVQAAKAEMRKYYDEIDDDSRH